MELKEKREFLGQYQSAQARIIGLTCEIEKWEQIGTKVNNAITATCAAGNNESKVEKSAVNVADIVTTLQECLNTALNQRDEVLNVIEAKCPKMRYREVLEMRFVHGMSEYEISKVIKKEEKSVSKIITTAIKELDI